MYKYASNQDGFLRRVSISFIISLISYLTLSLICCVGLFLTKNPTAPLKIVSFLSYLLSGAISGFISSKVIKAQPVVTSTVASLAFSCATFVISVFSGGNIVNMLMNIVCYVLISTLLAYLGSVKKSNKRRRR